MRPPRSTSVRSGVRAIRQKHPCNPKQKGTPERVPALIAAALSDQRERNPRKQETNPPDTKAMSEAAAEHVSAEWWPNDSPSSAMQPQAKRHPGEGAGTNSRGVKRQKGAQPAEARNNPPNTKAMSEATAEHISAEWCPNDSPSSAIQPPAKGTPEITKQPQKTDPRAQKARGSINSISSSDDYFT